MTLCTLLTFDKLGLHSVISGFKRPFRPLFRVELVGLLSREATESNSPRPSRLSSSCCPCIALLGLGSVIEGGSPGADTLSQPKAPLPCGDACRSWSKESRQVISLTGAKDCRYSLFLDWIRCLLIWRCPSSRLLSSGSFFRCTVGR